MAQNARCRVCLAVDVRMHWIKNTHHIEIFEKLASTKLNAEDGRLHTICYICYSQLQRCCRFSDMCHKSEQFLRDHLLCGTELAEGEVPPTEITHNLTVTALQFMSVIDCDYLSQENTEVEVKHELLIEEEIKFKEEPIDIEESVLIEDTTVDDNSTLQFMSVIDCDYSSQENTEVEVKHELLTEEEIKFKEEPIDIEESALVEDTTVDDNSIGLEQPPVTVITETKNVCASPYYCDVCGITFSMKYKLSRHMQIHFFNKPVPACTRCNEKFDTYSLLIAHMTIHTAEKPNKCIVCDKTFMLNSDLRKHLRTHTGVKPFACNQCNKTFREMSYLKRHMRVHSGEKPYECNICKKTYTESSTLKKHLRIHTGEKPFACNMCNTTFTEKGSLRRHIDFARCTLKVLTKTEFTKTHEDPH